MFGVSKRAFYDYMRSFNSKKWALEQIDLTKRMIAKHPEMVFVKTSAEARELMQKPHNTDFTIASSMGLESGHMIGSSQGLKKSCDPTFYDFRIHI